MCGLCFQVGDLGGKLLHLTHSRRRRWQHFFNVTWVRVSLLVSVQAAALVHQPLHHLDVEAEALVDGVGLPPNAGLEFEHLGLVHDEAILKNTAAALLRLKLYFN